MERTDILVVGGGVGGIVASITAKRCNPQKDVLILRREQTMLVPCGIPYTIGSLKNSEEDVVPDEALTSFGVRIKVDEAVLIDEKSKICKTKDGTDITYEKLILATGSEPVVPRWLEGADLKNVCTVKKDKKYLDEMLAKVKTCKKVVVLGGGFIGVEVADEINKLHKDVTIVEILPHVLAKVFDEPMCIEVEETLKSRGVKVKNRTGVKKIIGNKDKQVEGVLLDNKEVLEADSVILSMGYRPNTALIKNTNIQMNEMGFIKTNEFMGTTSPDIFAVGDCAEKRDFVTGKINPIMLASIASTEGRVAAMNLYNINTVKEHLGTIAIFSTSIGGKGFGIAGITENQARENKIDYMIGTFEGVDRHPKTLAEPHKQIVKLIVSKESGVIIGGEVMGGLSTGELVNEIGLLIQYKVHVSALLTTYIGTHPLLTAPPTSYPVIKAAEEICQKRKKLLSLA